MPQVVSNSNLQTVYLYQLLENLLLSPRSSVSHSTALWHISDPSRLVEYNSDDLLVSSTERMIESITFAQLNHLALRLANSIAHQINLKTPNLYGTDQNDRRQSETIVAIFMPPGIERVVCQIACMILNVGYLPLDCQIPAGRISYMLDLVKPVLLITMFDYEHHVEKIQIHQAHSNNTDARLVSSQMKKINIQNYEFLIRYSSGEMPDENLLSLRCDYSCCLFPNENNPVVIVLFTSGSTINGPKAVYLRTRELMNRLQWQWNPNSDMDLSKSYHKRIHKDHTKYPPIGLAKTAWVFVDAFTELFSCLFAGIPIVIPGGPNYPSEKCVSDVQQLINLVRYFRITHLTTVPAQLELWIKQLKLKTDNSFVKSLQSLRTIVVSGDILHPRLALEFFQFFPGDYRRLINLYGTTEVAGDVSGMVFKSTEQVNELIRTISISNHNNLIENTVQVLSAGLTIPNCQIFIVNNQNETNQFEGWKLHTTPDQSIGQISTNNCSEIFDESVRNYLKASGLRVLNKGQIGEVCITGLPVVKQIKKFNKFDQNGKLCENGVDDPNKPNLGKCFRPGDIGFIDPLTNQLYICGRTDDYIKRNGIRFHVREVDYLLEKFKYQHFKTGNILNDIQETVTLVVPEEWGRCINVACFYVLENYEDRTRYNQPNIPNQENFNLGIIKQQDIQISNKLSRILKDYVPTCLLPKFIRIDRIPLMPTSGKVDKGYLRQLYKNHYSNNAQFRNQLNKFNVCESNGLNEGSNLIKDDKNSIEKLTEKIDHNIGCEHMKNDYSDCDKTDKLYLFESPREQARRKIAEVLELKDTDGNLLPGRPTDEEDFFELGGDSLMAVYAMESLRQMNHVVDIHLFSKTGNIGAILSFLEHPNQNDLGDLAANPCNSLSNQELGRTHLLNTNESDFQKTIRCQTLSKEYTIYIEEWIEDNSSVTKEQIIELMSSSFHERDKTGLAFGLTINDHRCAIEKFLEANRLKNGIILIAQVPVSYSNGLTEQQLVGVLISLPSSVVPELNCTPNLKLIQSYFDACVGSEGDTLVDLETGLTVAMLSICSRPPASEFKSPHEMISKWRKATVDILSLMEGTLLDLALLRGFHQVDTLNTFEVTKEVCLELGYRITQTISLKPYMESKNMKVPAEYENLHCYFMIKSLK